MSRRTKIGGRAIQPELLTPAQKKQVRFLMRIYKRVDTETLIELVDNARKYKNTELERACQILIKRK
jgi:hypothetical protein